MRSAERGIRSTKDQVAPDIQFTDMDGQRHALSQFAGKVVLLNFWNTKCGPCIHEMPALSELQRKLRDRGFVLVYLSPEDTSVIARFFSGRNLGGVKGRLVPEQPAPAFYHSGHVWPISFLVNRQGVVKRSWLGEWQAQTVQDWIEMEL
jgi:thiol-disulfide isomerase/thioredoxin